nr:acetyltransferase [Vibrio cholerae]
MVTVVVVEFRVMRCQPLRRALYAYTKSEEIWRKIEVED